MNQQPQQTPMGSAPMGGMMREPQKKSSVGPIIGIVLVILIIVLGGLYFWGKRLADNGDTLPPLEEEPLSTSDEVSDIEADLDATDLESLDADAAAIEAELQ